MKFDIINDFMPDKGYIFVDTCGPTWVPGVKDYDLQIERLADFNRRFEERGHVLSTPKIFEEIRRSIKHFTKRRNLTIGDMYNYTNGQKKKCSISSSCARVLDAQKGIVENSNLLSILQRGRRTFNCRHGDVRVGDISKFYSEFNIHPPERELIVEATRYGDGNGILTADGAAIETYLAGLKEFGVGGFACDSRIGEVYHISSKEESFVSRGKRAVSHNRNGIPILG